MPTSVRNSGCKGVSTSAQYHAQLIAVLVRSGDIRITVAIQICYRHGYWTDRHAMAAASTKIAVADA